LLTSGRESGNDVATSREWHEMARK